MGWVGGGMYRSGEVVVPQKKMGKRLQHVCAHLPSFINGILYVPRDSSHLSV